MDPAKSRTPAAPRSRAETARQNPGRGCGSEGGAGAGPGEVEDAGGVEEALGRPGPVGDGAVDEEVPEADVGEGGPEAHALGEGADGEGGGDDGEGALEEDEGGLGDAGPAAGEAAAGRAHGRDARAVAGEPEALGAADEDAARAEGEGVAEGDPEERDEAGDGEDLEEDGEDVLLAGDAAVEEGQTGDVHHEDE